MSERTPQTACSRRSFVKAGAGTAAALAATGASGTALAQESPYGGYLSNTKNFNGKTADFTGQDEVTVEVGAGSNGLLFAPPAIKVDPGTKVIWEWTGTGSHNVVAEDGTFDSGSLVSEEGHTFSYTFEDAGLWKYYCNPHKTSGMKGVVAVGDNADGEVVDPSELSGSGSGVSLSSRASSYLQDANLYDGTVADKTGQSEVTVKVGGGENGFAFDPPAIHVDKGTTVVWEWTGKGGSHNVVAESTAFDSGSPQSSGTFSQTFDQDVTYTYYCNPHKATGMKGVVRVGAGGAPTSSGPGTAANERALGTLLGMVVLGLLSPIVFLLFARRKMSGPPRPE